MAGHFPTVWEITKEPTQNQRIVEGFGGAASLERTRLYPISLINREKTGNFLKFVVL
jgi:hypothetical protein